MQVWDDKRLIFFISKVYPKRIDFVHIFFLNWYNLWLQKWLDLIEIYRTANRNRATFQEFQGKVENLIQFPDVRKYNGSYRSETPAYISKEKDAGVPSTNNEFLTVGNANRPQLDNLAESGNIELDTRKILLVVKNLMKPK